jgi:hypothetical protein
MKTLNEVYANDRAKAAKACDKACARAAKDRANVYADATKGPNDRAEADWVCNNACHQALCKAHKALDKARKNHMDRLVDACVETERTKQVA